MRLIMRLTRFMCLALVMCIGLTAFAQDPEVIKSGNQATAVVNNTEFDFTLTLRFDGNKQSQKVNLPKGQRCEIKEDCYQINYNGKSGNHLWGRQKRQDSAKDPSAITATNIEQQVKETDQAEPVGKEQEKIVNNQQKESSNPSKKVGKIRALS